MDRRRALYDQLRRAGSGRVSDLAVALGVSEQTVRRDLARLEDDGRVQRVHGGAVLVDDGGDGSGAVPESAPPVRAGVRASAKQRIGARAAALIGPGETVLVSGGTTTLALIAALPQLEDVTVITNSLQVADALTRRPELQAIVLGGYLRHREMTLLGHLAEDALAGLSVSTAFTGCFGIDAELGLTGASVAEAATDRAMLSAARRVVALADATKLGRRGPVRMLEVERVTTLVTDGEAEPAAVAALRERGVEVLVG